MSVGAVLFVVVACAASAGDAPDLVAVPPVAQREPQPRAERSRPQLGAEHRRGARPARRRSAVPGDSSATDRQPSAVSS